MKLLTADMARRGAEVVAKMHREVQAMRGLFEVEIDGESYQMPVENYDWQPVPGASGVEMRALPLGEWPASPAVGADYFLSRGPAGARQPLLQIKQVVVNEVLKGEICFWKQSAPTYRCLSAGQVFTLEPNEPHGWRAVTAFECRVAFTPRITKP